MAQRGGGALTIGLRAVDRVRVPLLRRIVDLGFRVRVRVRLRVRVSRVVGLGKKVVSSEGSVSYSLLTTFFPSGE